MSAGALRSALALWLVLPFGFARLLEAGESAERRLDPELKLLYRAQRAERGVSATAPAGVRASDPLGSERALEVVRRVRGGGSRSSGDVSSEVPPSKGEPVEERLRLLVRSAGEATDLESVGFRVQARIGPIYTGTLPVSRLSDLAELEGVEYVQSSHELRAQGGFSGSAMPPPSARLPLMPFALPGAREYPSSSDAVGTGAIVGYVDTGVDILHEEFRTSGGQTRIKYLLDFSVPGDVDGDGDLDGPGCPDGSGGDPCFGGTLYGEPEINLALSSGSFGSKDVTGHGTHGLSVAAGDDGVSPGMAPLADLIVVKATRNDGTLAFESVDFRTFPGDLTSRLTVAFE